MGQLYSHLVFRPPSVCTYQNTNGVLKYVVPDHEGLPQIHSAPLIWLLNSMRFRIPCVMIRQHHNPNSEFVAIYAHQNGEDLGASVRDAHLISHSLGIDVLAFEYSGYGLSEKPRRTNHSHSRIISGVAVTPSEEDADRQRAEPSEKACCSDINAAYKYLTEQCNVSPNKIIIFGRSIGSGPAVYCAATRKVGGLVLIAPIASAVRVPLKHLNVTLPFIDTFPNIDRASKIRCPVLVIHGDMDELVPKLHAEKLFTKIKQHGNAVNPLWIPDARHNNVVEDFQSIVFGRYSAFLEEIKSMNPDKHIKDGNGKREKHHFPFFMFLRDAESEGRVFHGPPMHRRRLALSCLHVARDSIDSIDAGIHLRNIRKTTESIDSSDKVLKNNDIEKENTCDEPCSACIQNDEESFVHRISKVHNFTSSPVYNRESTPKRTRLVKIPVLESRAKTQPISSTVDISITPDKATNKFSPNDPTSQDFDKSVSAWLKQFKISSDATLQVNPTWNELELSIRASREEQQKRTACVAV